MMNKKKTKKTITLRRRRTAMKVHSSKTKKTKKTASNNKATSTCKKKAYLAEAITFENDSESAETTEDKEFSKLYSAFESNAQNSFFYTDELFLLKLDAKEILTSMLKKYPQLSLKNEDGVIKKALISMLQDEKFVKLLLDFYSISILELFKIICKSYFSIFKGVFLKKIKAELERHSYAD